MHEPIIARNDPGLIVRVLRQQPMTYADDPSDGTGHHPHVRAASGMTFFREYLVIVQDDANWLALIDADDVVHALPLPPAPESGTIFSRRTGNNHEKFDLEACVAVPGRDGPELVGFGSGSHRGREWILRVHESEVMAAALSQRAVHHGLDIDVTAEFIDATRFLEEHGLLVRSPPTAPIASSRYILTAKGEALRPVLDEIRAWSAEWSGEGPGARSLPQRLSWRQRGSADRRRPRAPPMPSSAKRLQVSREQRSGGCVGVAVAWHIERHDSKSDADDSGELSEVEFGSAVFDTYDEDDNELAAGP